MGPHHQQPVRAVPGERGVSVWRGAAEPPGPSGLVCPSPVLREDWARCRVR